MKAKRNNEANLGFTIIEVMIVVAILGILASVAMPAFVKYVRNSKTSAAVTSIRNIYDGQVAYFIAEQVDRNGNQLSNAFITCAATPTSVPPGVPVAGNWDSVGWRKINFALDSDTNYQFSVTTAGITSTSRFTATAIGDLDNDNIESTFERTGEVNTTTGEVEGSPGVYKLRPLE